MNRDDHRGRQSPNRQRGFAIWALRIALALPLTWIAYTKLSGTHNTIQYFAAIGWGQWFRYLTGTVDLVGVVLLFVPGGTYYGAMALTCSVGLATVISLTILQGNATWGGPAMVIVPLVITLLAAALAWLTRPSRGN
jgi:hypothetical protein